MRSLVLVGDSDISRWPTDLNPKGTIRNVGQSGATLDDVKHLIGQKSFQLLCESNSPTSFVVCAGENDIGSGISIASSECAMIAILDELLQQNPQNHVIFLGPKFEPWLTNDKSSRKSYFQLSLMQERLCRDRPKIHFVDCLTLFCGDTAEIPGARLAGRAKPESQYFDADGLHLSREGYVVWQGIVDEIVDSL